MKYYKWIAVLLIVMLASVSLNFSTSVNAQDDGEETEALVIDDFEIDEIFTGTDSNNNGIGYIPWGDTPGNVELSLAEMELEGESSSVLAVNYDIGSWGGFTHAFTDGETWLTQDWTAYDALQFWLYGNNSGGTVQVEIFDNRSPDPIGDSAERWFFRITDDYEGWQQFTIPFDSFQRRGDWQPDGAPSDGLGLTEVHGYAMGLPAGTGVTYVDQVELITLGAKPVFVSDFEVDELFFAQDEFGNNIGYVPWGDTDGNVALRLTDAVRNGTETRALTIDYDIAAWGGFSTIISTDGESWTGQDWSSYNAISFWYLGSNTGAEVQFEIFDNRSPESDGDTAERWFYRFADDSYGWKLVQIPFESFERRSDWQPDGAPDDGLNLDAVSGYAFGLPAGTGAKVAFVDDVKLFVMLDADTSDE